MFDISRIQIVNVRKNKYSFVGLRKEQGQLKFYLPHGFDEFSEHSFENISSLFFLLYKTLKKFESEISPLTIDRDGTKQLDGGFRFEYKESDPVVLYSRLTSIDSILTRYDDTAIFALIEHRSWNETIDYSQFDQIVEYANFTQNNTPVFEQVPNTMSIVGYSSTDLVSMYCYVLTEIKEQMNELDEVRNEIKTLAHLFKNRFLAGNSKLFSLEHYLSTIKLLKDTLEIIDKQTVYKSDDYWNYYGALEDFLYSEPSFNQEDGIFWGIKNFWPVWEDICHAYAFKLYGDFIKFADIDLEESRNLKGLQRRVYIADGFVNPFYSNAQGKWRIPDLVVLDSITETLYRTGQRLSDEFFQRYSIQLSKDNWNDYGHQISFNLTITNIQDSSNEHSGQIKFAKLADMLSVDEPESAYYDVGDVVGGSSFQITTALPKSWLSSTYISNTLQDFFEKKEDLFTFLYVLNDISLLSIIDRDRILLNDLKDSSIFTDALFRDTKVAASIEKLSDLIQDSEYKIVDYKYYPMKHCTNFRNLEFAIRDWVRKSLKKQEIYNDALDGNSDGISVSSEFWLPWYFNDRSQTYEEVDGLDKIFFDHRTKVMKIDFIAASVAYVNEL